MGPARTTRHRRALASAALLAALSLTGACASPPVPVAPTIEPATPPNRGPRVQARFTGNVVVPASELAAVAKLDEDPAVATNEDNLTRSVFAIASLYLDRGHMQVDIEKPRITTSKDGVVTIELEIHEGRRFRMERLTVEERDERGQPVEPLGGGHAMRELVALKDGDWVRRAAVADGVAKIQALYGDQGYAFVDVLPNSKIDDARGTVSLVLEIKRGAVATIERVRITSSKPKFDNLPEAEIKELVGFASGATFNATKLSRAEERLRAHPRVKSVEVTLAPGSAKDRVLVTFAIEERP